MEKSVQAHHIDKLIQAVPQIDTYTDGHDWREGLPVITGQRVLLRDLRPSDAPPLCALLTAKEVQRFISPPPETIEGFERFVAKSRMQRREGELACFAVTLRGNDPAIGIIQIRKTERAFATAEWGFALGSPFWGMGLFQEAARLTLQFAFERLGVHRLEARAALKNGRGNGALRKLGAVPECVLRRSFLRNGEYLDQALWTILQDEWLRAKAVWTSPAIH